MNILESTLGANWRTTLSGSLFVVAGGIAARPDLVGFLPDSIRGYVVGAATLTAFLSGGTFATLAKDKQVTGGSVQQAEPIVKKLVPLIIAALLLSTLSGCACNTNGIWLHPISKTKSHETDRP